MAQLINEMGQKKVKNNAAVEYFMATFMTILNQYIELFPESIKKLIWQINLAKALNDDSCLLSELRNIG